MAGTTAEAQVAKRQYKNQTAGWLGVVKLDHLGAQQGHPVPPMGTVYLSDDEAILTARAPANPKDNPFEEQSFMFADAQGQHVEQKMRPLILLGEGDGEDGDERYVPVGDISPAVAVAEKARTEATLDQQDAAPRTVPTAIQEPTQVAGSPLAAVDPAHARPAAAAATFTQPPTEEEMEDIAESDRSWVENPSRTEAPQQGSLAGSDEPGPAAPQGTQESVSGQAPPPQQPVQQTVGAQQGNGGKTVPSESAGTGEAAGAPSEQGGAAEETAGVTKAGEETGAADTPSGQAPEGEFAAHEEVGSPDAPSAEAEQAS